MWEASRKVSGALRLVKADPLHPKLGGRADSGLWFGTDGPQRDGLSVPGRLAELNEPQQRCPKKRHSEGTHTHMHKVQLSYLLEEESQEDAESGLHARFGSVRGGNEE